VTSEVVKVDPKRERVLNLLARDTLVAWAVSGKESQKSREKLCKEVDLVAADLAGPSPSAIEVMLSDTAAVCWCALRIFEVGYASSSTSKDGLTFRGADFHLRRIDGAHRRLMNTLKTLATVRRLAGPAVQVNVAQQVNVAGPNGPATIHDRE
jgi:hypothetical protein